MQRVDVYSLDIELSWALTSHESSASRRDEGPVNGDLVHTGFFHDSLCGIWIQHRDLEHKSSLVCIEVREKNDKEI